MAPELDVLAIGSAIVDVLAHADDAFLQKEGLVKGTMALIDAEQADALYQRMGPGLEASGGSAANTAAGLASFGARVGFIGRVRDDQLGDVFTHDIRAIGVEYRTPPANDGPATARCLVLITPDAQRTLNTYLGAAADLGIEDIDEALVRGAAVTYVEGYLWDPPGAIAAIRHAMAVAHEAGRKVALTLSDPFCVDRHRGEFLALLDAGEVDILFGNEDELLSLVEQADLDAAVDYVRARCEVVAITRSELGCVVARGEDLEVVPAVPIDELVDTTGAGDLFAAGFLYGFTSGASLRRCGELGAKAAAAVITTIGPRPQQSLAGLK